MTNRFVRLNPNPRFSSKSDWHQLVETPEEYDSAWRWYLINLLESAGTVSNNIARMDRWKAIARSAMELYGKFYLSRKGCILFGSPEILEEADVETYTFPELVECGLGNVSHGFGSAIPV